MAVLKAFIILALQFIVSGCFFNSSITSTLPESTSSPELPTLGKASTFENVSGSTTYSRTVVSGYRVKQSAGLLLNKQLAKTPNGYKVFLHVNGRMTSEE